MRELRGVFSRDLQPHLMEMLDKIVPHPLQVFRTVVTTRNGRRRQGAGQSGSGMVGS